MAIGRYVLSEHKVRVLWTLLKMEMRLLRRWSPTNPAHGRNRPIVLLPNLHHVLHLLTTPSCGFAPLLTAGATRGVGLLRIWSKRAWCGPSPSAIEQLSLGSVSKGSNHSLVAFKNMLFAGKTSVVRRSDVSLSTVVTPCFAQAYETLIVDSWLTEEASRIKIRKWASENQYEVCCFLG